MNTRPSQRVLIVDDQAHFRRQLHQLLTLAGLQVVAEAGDIEAAQQLACALQPDLAVMDIMMPGGSGIQGARNIKSVAPATRVILVSAHGDQVHLFQAAAEAIGAEAFVPKDALNLDVVRGWLGN